MNVLKPLAAACLSLIVTVSISRAQTPVTPPGTGAADNPYQISQLGHLVWMGQNPEYRKYYLMTQDIDASQTTNWNSGAGFQPIYLEYACVFEGNSRTIRNLFINRPAETNVGLFSEMDGDEIRNLILEGGSIRGGRDVGSIAGDGHAILRNCRSSVTVVGFNYVGGLAGGAGDISDCTASGSVSGSNTVGGLVGLVFGTVSNCRASGAVTGVQSVGGLIGTGAGACVNSGASGSVTGVDSVGGLFGDSHMETLGCYATGAVEGHSSVGGLAGYGSFSCSGSRATGSVRGFSSVGGLVGRLSDIGAGGVLAQSYATGDVTGTNYVGGLIGSAEGMITNCYASGNVFGTSAVGGLVGRSDATCVGTRATGRVNGGDDVGGLIGRNEGQVRRSYATGKVAGTYFVGGLLGVHISPIFSTNPCAVATECGAAGAVAGSDIVGGLAGGLYYGAVLSNCYARGSVDGGTNTGGLVGYIPDFEDLTGKVVRCYASGLVLGDTELGGLVGTVLGEDVTGSYWDTNTTGQISSSGGTGLGTALMMQRSSFTGWDFANVWTNIDGFTRPYLRAIPQIEGPMAWISRPADGKAFRPGIPIRIKAQTSEAWAIQKVEFFQGTTKLGEDTMAAYEHTWTNAAIGSYELTVRAWNTPDNVWTSAPVTVIVDPAAPAPSLTWLSILLGG